MGWLALFLAVCWWVDLRRLRAMRTSRNLWQLKAYERAWFAHFGVGPAIARGEYELALWAIQQTQLRPDGFEEATRVLISGELPESSHPEGRKGGA